MKKSKKIFLVVGGIFFTLILVAAIQAQYYSYADTSISHKEERKRLNNDLEAIKTYLTQCYVAYDEAVEKGFNIDKAIRDIKKHYKLSVMLRRRHNYMEDFNLINGICEGSLLYALERVFKEQLLILIADNHFNFVDTKGKFGLIYDKIMYYSGVFVEKKKDGLFYVVESSASEVHKGLRYEDYRAYLYPRELKGDNIYEICKRFPYDDLVPYINFSGNSYYVDFNEYPIKTKKNHLGLKETKDSIYFSVSDCLLGSYDKELYKKTMKRYKELLEKAQESNNKKNVIIDVRGNVGGYPGYILNLVSSVLYGNKPNTLQLFKDDYTSLYNNLTLLRSVEIAKAIYNENNDKYHIDESTKKELYKDYERLLKEPRRYYYRNTAKPVSELPQYKMSDFKGKIYFLIDSGVSSAAEFDIASSYLEDQAKIVLIGENSNGCVDFGGRYIYELPNSKIRFSLCNIDYRELSFLKYNPKWKGETKGFEPDYWANPTDILETLVYVTGDEELTEELVGLNDGLL